MSDVTKQRVCVIKRCECILRLSAVVVQRGLLSRASKPTPTLQRGVRGEGEGRLPECPETRGVRLLGAERGVLARELERRRERAQ